MDNLLKHISQKRTAIRPNINENNMWKNLMSAIVFVQFFVSCTLFERNRITVPDCTISYNDLKRIINTSLSKDLYKGCLNASDTLILFDEDVEWKGVSYTDKDGTLLFTLEANWEDSSKVAVINIHNDKMLSEDVIKIGDSFGDKKQYFDSMIPNMPDGYFALDRKGEKGIRYFFNRGSGLDSMGGFDELPKDLIVESIMITAND